MIEVDCMRFENLPAFDTLPMISRNNQIEPQAVPAEDQLDLLQGQMAMAQIMLRQQPQPAEDGDVVIGLVCED